MLPPAALASAHALSISFAYSGFLDAARISDGLVVASCGLYFAMAVSCFVSDPVFQPGLALAFTYMQSRLRTVSTVSYVYRNT